MNTLKNEIEFVDAVQMNKDYPDSFEIPSQKSISLLTKGDFVKVCTCGERFWVMVYENQDGVIRGTIDNELVCSDDHGLYNEDELEFEHKNVCSIMYEEVSSPERYLITKAGIKSGISEEEKQRALETLDFKFIIQNGPFELGELVTLRDDVEPKAVAGKLVCISDIQIVNDTQFEYTFNATDMNGIMTDEVVDVEYISFI